MEDASRDPNNQRPKREYPARNPGYQPRPRSAAASAAASPATRTPASAASTTVGPDPRGARKRPQVCPEAPTDLTAEISLRLPHAESPPFQLMDPLLDPGLQLGHARKGAYAAAFSASSRVKSRFTLCHRALGIVPLQEKILGLVAEVCHHSQYRSIEKTTSRCYGAAEDTTPPAINADAKAERSMGCAAPPRTAVGALPPSACRGPGAVCGSGSPRSYSTASRAFVSSSMLAYPWNLDVTVPSAPKMKTHDSLRYPVCAESPHSSTMGA